MHWFQKLIIYRFSVFMPIPVRLISTPLNHINGRVIHHTIPCLVIVKIEEYWNSMFGICTLQNYFFWYSYSMNWYLNFNCWNRGWFIIFRITTSFYFNIFCFNVIKYVTSECDIYWSKNRNICHATVCQISVLFIKFNCIY